MPLDLFNRSGQNLSKIKSCHCVFWHFYQIFQICLYLLNLFVWDLLCGFVLFLDHKLIKL